MQEGSDTAIYAISTKNERKRRKYLPGGYARVQEDMRGCKRMQEDAEGARGCKRMQEGSDTAIYAISTKHEEKKKILTKRVCESARGRERVREDARGCGGCERTQEDARGCKRMQESSDTARPRFQY